jgi:hypothetical protein
VCPGEYAEKFQAPGSRRPQQCWVRLALCSEYWPAEASSGRGWWLCQAELDFRVLQPRTRGARSSSALCSSTTRTRPGHRGGAVRDQPAGHLCRVFPVTVTVAQLRNGEAVGDEADKFGVQTLVELSATSARFVECVAVVGLATAGDDPGVDPTITLTSQCDQPCRDTSPQLLPVGTPKIAPGGNSNGADAPSNQVVRPAPAPSGGVPVLKSASVRGRRRRGG